MSTFWKFGPKLALCCVVCGLCLVGWAGRLSIAQSGGQDSPPPATKPEEPKAAIQEAKPDAPKGEPAVPFPAPVSVDALQLPRETDGPGSELSLKPMSPPAPAPVVVGPDHSPFEVEDPEKVAGDFLEQNQKMAEAQLKALKEEAEKLKTRLAKVEAGIKRWDRLVEALKQSGNATELGGAVEPAGKEKRAETPAERTERESIERNLGIETPRARAEPTAKLPDTAKPAGVPGELAPR
jgi:hypothetical protein